MKTNYFESSEGNRSSSRLTSFIVIMSAILMCWTIIILGKQDIVSSATAAGVLFITIAGPAMAFQFSQKKTEQINKQ